MYRGNTLCKERCMSGHALSSSAPRLVAVPRLRGWWLCLPRLCVLAHGQSTNANTLPIRCHERIKLSSSEDPAQSHGSSAPPFKTSTFLHSLMWHFSATWLSDSPPSTPTAPRPCRFWRYRMAANQTAMTNKQKLLESVQSASENQKKRPLCDEFGLEPPLLQ